MDCVSLFLFSDDETFFVNEYLKIGSLKKVNMHEISITSTGLTPFCICLLTLYTATQTDQLVKNMRAKSYNRQ